MPAERKGPDKETLTKWYEEGLSRAEMVERTYELTGNRITVQAISTAASRFGLKPRRNRWEDMLPWRVVGDHVKAKEATLLRMAGRRRAGLENSPDEMEVWLDGWLQELIDKGRPVVTYYPDSPDGFYYVPRVPEDGDGEWDLIRRPEVQKLLDEKSS